MLFFSLSVVCLIWLHLVARRLMKEKAPELLRELEEEVGGAGFVRISGEGD